MEALDQGLDSHREAIDPSGRRPRDAVSRVDVQEEVLTIQPANSRALGQPLSPPRVACGPAGAPAPSSGIVWYAAVARGDVRPSSLFQVIAERAEKAAVILTTNLPFSEWTQVIPNARLCKALVDRITDRAHIVETGSESYRFRRTLDKRKSRNPKEP
jgi:hypothetical protein